MNQPTNEELLRQCLDGTLEPDLRQRAGDSDALGLRVQAALNFAALLQETPLELPPKKVQRAARAANRPAPGESRIKLLLASLFTPSAEPQLAFRGRTSAPQLFHAGPFELDVLQTSSGALVCELAAREDKAELPTEGTCSLFGPDGVRTAEIQDGEFRFDSVDPGTYQMVLDFNLGSPDSLSIVVSEVTI